MRIPAIQKNKLHLAKPEVRFIFNFLVFIKRNRIKFFVLLLVIALTEYLIYTGGQKYKSNLTLFINTSQATKLAAATDENITQAIKQSSSLHRLNQIVFSEEMTDYLNKEFDLLEHYGIKPSDYSKNSLINMLRQSIKISIDYFDVIKIEVSDVLSSELTRNMANSIAKKAAEINRTWYINQINQSIQINELVLQSLKSNLDSQKILLDESIQSLREISPATEDIRLVEKREAFISINNISNTINKEISEFSQAYKNYSFTLNTATEKNFNEMIILQKALKGMKTPDFSFAMLFPGIFIIALISSTIIFYLVFALKKYFFLLKHI